MPVVEGSSEDIRNLMRLAYLTGCIIAPLGGVVLKEQSAFMYRVFEGPLFFQASFKMRLLSKSLIFETNTIGHATPIPVFFQSSNNRYARTGIRTIIANSKK
jgi:hypothetical protein